MILSAFSHFLLRQRQRGPAGVRGGALSSTEGLSMPVRGCDVSRVECDLRAAVFCSQLMPFISRSPLSAQFVLGGAVILGVAGYFIYRRLKQK